MTSPIVVGQVAVEVTADARRFAQSLKREMNNAFRDAGIERAVKNILDQIKVDVPVRATASEADAAKAGVTASSVAERAAPPVHLRVDIDRKAIAGAAKKLAGLLSGAGSAALRASSLALGAGVAATAVAGLASAAAGAVPVLIGLGAAVATAAGALVAVPGAIGIAQAAIGTLKVGLIGLDAAFKAVGSGDSKALDEALKNLAPNAQKFVKQVNALRKGFDRLRLKVQNALFADTAKTLAALAKSTLPTLTTGMTGLATAINRQVVTALTALNTRANQGRIAQVFTAARETVNQLGVAMRPVGQALLDLVGVGAQLTAQFTEGLGREIGSFAEQVSKMAASGDLARIFRDGLSAAGELLKLGQDVIGIFGGIARAAGGDGGAGGLFSFFDRLNAVINRSDVQQALRATFDALADIGVALTPVLTALAPALVPIAKGIAEIAKAFAPGLVKVAAALGEALGGLAPAIKEFAPSLSSIAEGLAPLGGILADLLAGAAPGFNALIQGLAEGLGALEPVAPIVGKALGDIAVALAPLLPLLGQVLANALTVLAPLFSGLVEAAMPLVELFANTLVAAQNTLLPAMLELGRTVLPLVTTAVSVLAQAFAPLVPVIVQIAQILAGQLIAVMPQLQQMLTQLLPVLTQVATQFGQALLQALIAIMPVLPDLIKAGLDLTLALLGLYVALAPLLPVLTEIALAMLKAWTESGALNLVVKAMTGLVYLATNTVRAFTAVVNGVLSPLRGAKGAVDSFGRAASSAANSAKATFTRLPSTIKAALGNTGRLLFDAGRNVIQGLINGIRNQLGALGNIMSSVGATVRSYLPFSPAKEGPLSGKGNPYYSGQSIVQLLSSGVRSQLSVAEAAATDLAATFAAAAAPADTLGALARTGVDLSVGDRLPPDVRVFIGDRELADIVRVEISEKDRRLKRRVTAATGA